MKLGQLIAATQVFTKAGLAAGTTSTYSTTATVVATILGKFATSLTAQTNQATPTTDARTGAAFVALAVSQGCLFVFGIDLAGAIKVVQGPIEALHATDDTFKVNPSFPEIPDTVAPFGYAVVRNGAAGSAWTFGASNWSATALAEAFVDIGTLPARPQSS